MSHPSEYDLTDGSVDIGRSGDGSGSKQTAGRFKLSDGGQSQPGEKYDLPRSVERKQHSISQNRQHHLDAAKWQECRY